MACEEVIYIAELTLTLIMAAAKRLPEVSAHIRDGGWRSYDLLGTEIDGKVLGLIGLGAIGRAVASRFQALGRSVLGFDPFVTTERAAAHGIQSVTFEELLERSDFVSVRVRRRSPVKFGTPRGFNRWRWSQPVALGLSSQTDSSVREHPKRQK
jgi:phosphoglycerate dehydrogenase-like enzyme